MNENRPCSDAMHSFTDGTIFQSHILFSQHPDAIRLHFYADEFEVCNPIGAKRGKHKVLAVYYIVGNMEKKYWSELKFIHLCILVRYQLVKEYDPSYSRLLAPLIAELKELASDGMEVTIDGTVRKFYAALATFSADNLTAHNLAGFQRHFSNGRICRYCMANYDEISLSYLEDKFCIRSKAVHEYHLQALEANAANGPVYGVLNRCPLLDLPYVDITQVFVPDIMHDLMEGVIPSLVQKVVHRSVHNNLVSLDLLNRNLERACKNLSDKPNAITQKNVSSSGTIVGSAAQKWQLFLSLPQVVGKYFSADDPVWQVYVKLRAVTDLVFAPVVKKSSLSYLTGLVAEFLAKYAEVFGGHQLAPKHHYMIHYARLMNMFGPLRPLWCMRFESKHQYFKSVINSLGNYINVTSSMARRHQMRQCCEFMNEDILHSEPQSLSGTSVWQITRLPTDLRETLMEKLQIDIDGTECVTVTKRLLFSHTLYEVESCFVLNVVEAEEIPIFLKVKYIVSFRDTWLLCGRLCFCQTFNEHLHAYSVKVDDGWAVAYPGEEVDHTMHKYFVQDNSSYITVAYHVTVC